MQANANVADLAKRLKQAEAANGELARRVDELSGDLHNAQAENARLAADNARLKQQVGDLEARNDTLARENKNLSGKNFEKEKCFKKIFMGEEGVGVRNRFSWLKWLISFIIFFFFFCEMT